ncbi:MAG: aldehyde dehydrogenase family protein [Alsobacter sp.]
MILEELARVCAGEALTLPTIFIDGVWSDAASSRTLPTIDPSAERQLAFVSRGGAEDVDRAARSALDALHGPWAALSASRRGQLLSDLAAALARSSELIAMLECLEVGKPLSSARGDVEGAVETVRYNAGAADKLEGATIPVSHDVVDFTLLEPLGVTAHIVPWNFPIGMALRSVAPALAAGCTAVLKPAEQSSLSALALCALASDVGFPPGVLNLVTGLGPEAGEMLCRHPLIRGITFTGSVETGRRVYAAAAQGLKPVVLELGGKNPMIVFPDADLDKAVTSALMGAFENCGQVCAASSRLLVHEAVADAFCARLSEKVQRLRVGPGLDDLDLGPVVSDEQLQKVVGLVSSSRGRVVTGGSRAASFGKGFFFQPTLVDHVEPADVLAAHEVFGPVVAIQRFATEAEALALANGLPYGLAAGVHTSDISRALRFAKQLQAGSVWINGWFLGGVQAPNGGVKESGIGRERGQPGIRNYVSIKNVAVQL